RIAGAPSSPVSRPTSPSRSIPPSSSPRLPGWRGGGSLLPELSTDKSSHGRKPRPGFPCFVICYPAIRAVDWRGARDEEAVLHPRQPVGCTGRSMDPVRLSRRRSDVRPRGGVRVLFLCDAG